MAATSRQTASVYSPNFKSSNAFATASYSTLSFIYGTSKAALPVGLVRYLYSFNFV